MMQKFAVNLLAGDYPDYLIPLLVAIICAVVVAAVVFAITIVHSKRKNNQEVEILPIEYEEDEPEPEQKEPVQELPKDEFEGSEEENEAIAEELDSIEQELEGTEDGLTDIENEETEESAEPTEEVEEEVVEEQPAEEEVAEEVVEEIAEEQPVVEEAEEEVAEQVEQQPADEQVEEAEEEVSEEVAEEQPEEVSEETEEVSDEVIEEEQPEEVTEEVEQQPADEQVEEAEEEVSEAVEEQPAVVEEAEEEVSEAVEEQPAVVEEAGEEVSAIPETEEENTVVRSVNSLTGLAVIVRYKKSYKAKYIQSGEETKSYYTMLKNAMLSYKKVKSRVSWGQENFNSGRNNIARFTMRGKSLCIYFALNPDDYANTKYKVERSLSKKYEGVPCLYRIKNGRRAKYALDLISALMEKYGLVKGEEKNDDYYQPYEPTEQLVEEGLIKELIKEEDYNEFLRLRAERANSPDEDEADEIAAAEVEEVAEEVPEIVEEVTEVVVENVVEENEQPAIVEEVTEVVEEVVQQPEEEIAEEVAVAGQAEEEVAAQEEEVDGEAFREQSRQEVEEKRREEVSAEEVNKIIGDKVAVALVEKKTGGVTVSGKKAIINIDVLSSNFGKNEIVNLESLRAKNLVAKNVTRIKILARGTLTKPLTVEANDFSIEAVKMIVVTGGKAVKV